MAILYSLSTTLTVNPNNSLVYVVDGDISPTTRYYGVRSSFTGQGGKSKNFEFVATHYGIGRVWALWEGFVVKSWYIEHEGQYYGTFTCSDFYSEPSFIYPDASVDQSNYDTETSKIRDENSDPTFNYTIIPDVGYPLVDKADVDSGSSIGDSTARMCFRSILKSKDRLFADCLKADAFAIQLFSTAKQPVSFEFLHIR